MQRNSRNPHQSSHDKSREAIDLVHFEEATVISAPSHNSGDGVKHAVTIKPAGKDVQFPAEVPVDAKGDVHIPEEGTDVLIGYRKASLPVVLSARYNVDDTIPAYEAGERRVGHSLSNANLFLDASGNVVVENDNGTNVTLSGTSATIGDGAGTTVTIENGNIKLTNSDGSSVNVQNGDITLDDNNGTTVTLSAGTLTLNGGTQGAITDVTTTKDVDGHVTSISLIRNNNILI